MTRRRGTYMGRKLAWEKKYSELEKGNKNYLLSALSSTSYHPQSHAPLYILAVQQNT